MKQISWVQYLIQTYNFLLHRVTGQYLDEVIFQIVKQIECLEIAYKITLSWNSFFHGKFIPVHTAVQYSRSKQIFELLSEFSDKSQYLPRIVCIEWMMIILIRQ